MTGADSLRRLSLCVAVALTVAAATAPQAGTVRSEHWQGVWETKHKFGTPELELKQDDDIVKGTYTSKGGASGKINGELSGTRKRVWSGKFRDTKGGNSKGIFNVKLQDDLEHFEGWFKTCGLIGCSKKYDWRGKKT
jgi:hypothetical protein